MKVFVAPSVPDTPDTGEGGIRRTIEGHKKHLRPLGVEFVSDPEMADVIHGHASHIVDTRKKIPTVLTVHGLYWSDYAWAPRWCHAANRGVVEAMLRADAVVGVSEWVTHALQRGTMIPARTIYHGVDAEDFTPGENGGYVLWNKTRIDPVCDPAPLNELARRAPDTQFVSTFGDERPNVHLIGRTDYATAQGFVRNAGVYLCTSRETFGIGTLEAMAAGVPILGFAWGGQREIVQHLETGFLVRPYDYDGLLEGLRYCLEHRERLGENARQDVLTRWGWANPACQYHNLYLELITKAKTNRPRVSVVIPSYNMADLLPRAVDSVLKQEGAPTFEVVIVDDASTDDTPAVSAGLAAGDPRVRVIRNPQNLYLAGALNVGMTHARGEYVLPLDADNELGPPALHTLAHFLDNDPTLDIVYGKMHVISEATGEQFTSDWPPRNFTFTDQMKHKNQISSTALYRKKIWQRVGGYRRRCRTAEDADFWTRATSYGARAQRVTDLVTLIYHHRSDSMSQVEADWDWPAWYPWSHDRSLTPPARLDVEHDLLFPSYEPTLISVVIPCSEAHIPLLQDALDSVAGQTFPLWEVIVVFDMPAVPNVWLPPYVRAYATGKERPAKGRKKWAARGPAQARNVGIAKARGTYILPLDADDYLQPNALEAMYDLMQKIGGQTFVYADFIKQETGARESVNDWTCEEILGYSPYPVSSLIPYAAWEAVGGYDEKIDAWEDWDFYLALHAAGYCGARCPQHLLYYRIYAGERREAQYAKRGEGYKNIHAKWGDYIDGRKPFMACGGCGQRSQAAIISMPQVSANMPMDEAGWVNLPQGQMAVVEYIGTNQGPMTFVGQNTQRRYRFGKDPEYLRQYIDRTDLDLFYNRRDFKVHLYGSAEETRAALNGSPVSYEGVVLEAAGPPKR